MMSLTPHWQARQRFSGLDDYMLYLYDRILRRVPKLPLPRRGSMTGISLKEHLKPFHIRLGATDLLVLEEMFQRGEYSVVGKEISQAKRIVDLGANVGFSLRYWHTLFPAAKILAVEPNPGNCRVCQENLKAAGFAEQVRLVQACVGAHRRQVTMGGDEEWAYRMMDAQSRSGEQMPVLTLLELLDEHFPGESIDLLKCDIEGAEAELFEHCSPWISRVRAIVVELHPPYTAETFFSHLAQANACFEVVSHFKEKECPVIFLRVAKP
ncbi:MAG: FkbM family methyltransferase [Verrucomicrobiota bacterium]|nr:FkbM family methyltransferase [Verrucomicrobiota bacterium]